MLTISPPFGSRKAEEYFEEELSQTISPSRREAERVHTFWAGTLARELGLTGPVDDVRFRRLARGRDPRTDEVLIRQTFGRGGKTGGDHRAGLDFAFSAPKSVSITAVLGKDERVREAHRAAVRLALEQIEHYAHAHLGGTRGREITRNLAIACFEHDSARPVGDRADVQLHTHSIVFNMTRAHDKVRSLEPRELFRSQRFATAVYRAHLAAQLQALGYTIRIDSETGAPEIVGYTTEYLDSASQRSQQIDAALTATSYRRNARSASVAVRKTRARKERHDAEAIRAAQLEHARRYGNQHLAVIDAMRRRGPVESPPPGAEKQARAALEFAFRECTERDAVTDVRRVLEVALSVGMARTSLRHVYEEFWRALESGRIVRVANTRNAAAGITTREMIDLERANVAYCLERQGRCAPLFSPAKLTSLVPELKLLSRAQVEAFRNIGEQGDAVHVLQGYAGVGKTRLLRLVASAARLNGYEVVGLAPSGTARDSLAAGGVPADTLQKFLVAGSPSNRPRLLVLDEASLASTRQVSELFRRLGPADRVLIVGDIAQHESVDAGRMFGQLQEAGLNRTVLDEIRRQEDPELLKAVDDLAHGDVSAAVSRIRDDQIRQFRHEDDRFRAIAREYCRAPDSCVVVAPTHEERFAITAHIRAELHAQQLLGSDVEIASLDPRNDVTETARRKAFSYRVGDVLRYRTGSGVYRIGQGSYARVKGVDVMTNTLVVETEDGRPIIYDPERVSGVEIYRERTRRFATGDRVVMTRAHQTRRIPKGANGTIVDLEGTRARIRLDRGGETTLDIAEWRHLDHAYTVTSHASQSLSVGRVLINVESTLSESMLNQRFAYVATSRAIREAVIFTDRKELLEARLSREYGNRSALDALRVLEGSHQPSPTPPVTPATTPVPDGSSQNQTGERGQKRTLTREIRLSI